MNIKRIALCSLVQGIFALGVAKTDTLHVGKAALYGPFGQFSVYQTDSMDMNNARLNASKEFFNSNTPALLCNGVAAGEVKRGDALEGNKEGSLNVMKFSVTSTKYTRANLITKALREAKIYVNGKPQNGSLTLQPGSTDIEILCLTKIDTASAGKTPLDTFNVFLTGADIADVITVNPEKRAYGLQEMNLGLHVSSLLLSPSGKYLITNYYNTTEKGENLFYTVLSETASGKVLRRYSTHESIKWMKGKEDLLYLVRRGLNGKELIVCNPTTQEEKCLTNTLPDGSYTLSPNADYLIISKSQNAKGGKEEFKRLIMPDDRMGGWRNRSALYRYDLKTGLTQRLTFGSQSVHLAGISDDGNKLLFSYSRMDVTRLPFHRTTFLSMDAYTGKVDTLLADTAFVADAKFSPDGSKLLIKASANAFENLGSELPVGTIGNGYDYRLYLYDIATKKTEPLLMGFNPTVSSYNWNSADGYIYFAAEDGTDKKIYRLDAKTKKVTEFHLPITYVTNYSFSQTKSPSLAFTGQTGVSAREAYICELGKNSASKCKRIGEADFSEMSKDWLIPECHDWSFKSSRGDSIDGFYYLPVNFSPEKKYPLIVYYYGGCTPTAKTLEFQFPLSVMASMGYVVYAVNPSGCTGYGQEFAARHVGTWGKESGDDIIEGTKAFAKAHSFVDEKKIGCMGASYGGFMTQYLQTRTDIFAAAISHAGISNIASYWGGGYWGYTYGMMAQYGSYPWNNKNMYVGQSPLFNAEKINTPLLLLHGTVDTNVPTNESQQLFTALRILGKRVSYITIDATDHVVTDFNKKHHWHNTLFAWLARWLKDEPEWWDALYPNDKY